jgi:hypothetical protein
MSLVLPRVSFFLRFASIRNYLGTFEGISELNAERAGDVPSLVAYGLLFASCFSSNLLAQEVFLAMASH